MNNVLLSLEGLATGIDAKQDEETLYSFFEIAAAQLDTIEEKRAIRLGALALFADVAKMPVKAFYYRHKFRKAMRKLEA